MRRSIQWPRRRLTFSPTSGLRVLVDEGLHLRVQGVGACDELADGMLAPHQPTLLGHVDLGVRRVVELVGEQAQRRREGGDAGGAQRAGLVCVGGGVEPEAEALEPADELVVHPDLAVFGHCGHQALPLLQPPHQDRGAAVDETLGQLHVQRIRQPVFYRTGLVAPMVRVVDPRPALGDVGPCADICQPLRQRVDVAVGSIDAGDLPREPVGRDAAPALQEAEEPDAEAGVLGQRHLAEVGDLADVPEQAHVRRGPQAVADLGDAGELLQGGEVVGLAGALQVGMAGRRLEAGHQPLRGAELEGGVAPLQPGERAEAVVLDRLDLLRVERRRLAGDAEGAVGGEAAGAAGDLRQLVGAQVAMAAAIELHEAGEGDVGDVEVEPHADGVGGDQVVHVAVLVERDLGVAGAWRERAHHHGGAAFLPPQQLGDGVDVLDREADDRAPRRHPAELAGAGIAELREALALDQLRAWHQRGDAAAHGLGAEEQRLLQAAGVQQPVGEDVAAVGVAAELDLVDGEEVRSDVDRHRLDGADPVGGARRHDALLAGDERHHRRTAQADDAVVDLAGEEPERQADDAGAVRQHPFDRVVRLAGVGRPQHRHDPRRAIECHARQLSGIGARPALRARRRRSPAPAAWPPG